MIRRLVIGLLVAANAVLAVGALQASAQADITFLWKYSPNVNEDYWIDNGVPMYQRSAIQAGVETFSDRASGNGPKFVYQGVKAEAYNHDNACAGGSMIFSVDRSAIGETTFCVETYGGQERLVGFDIVLDSSQQWYGGTGTPGANQWDTQSIATHEAGHATGMLGHFDDGVSHCPVPRTSVTATMCQGSTDILGTTWLRSLTSADIDRLGQAY